MSDVKVTITRNAEGEQRLRQAVFKGVHDVFMIDILGRAKDLSPVSDENPQIGDRYRPTGNNRNSLDADVKVEGSKVEAQVYSQSGYGGYLEVGTHLMKARPYINPAVDEFLPTLPDRVREKLNG